MLPVLQYGRHGQLNKYTPDPNEQKLELYDLRYAGKTNGKISLLPEVTNGVDGATAL